MIVIPGNPGAGRGGATRNPGIFVGAYGIRPDRHAGFHRHDGTTWRYWSSLGTVVSEISCSEWKSPRYIFHVIAGYKQMARFVEPIEPCHPLGR